MFRSVVMDRSLSGKFLIHGDAMSLQGVGDCWSHTQEINETGWFPDCAWGFSEERFKNSVCVGFDSRGTGSVDLSALTQVIIMATTRS